MFKMETGIRNVERIVLRYNRLINNSYVFLDTNDKLDAFEMADLSSCLIMIYKELREIIVGEILADEDIAMCYYVMRETVEYMFETSSILSKHFVVQGDYSLAYELFLEIIGTIGLIIDYSVEEEEYEVSVNLSKFRRKFIETHFKKCMDM